MSCCGIKKNALKNYGWFSQNWIEVIYGVVLKRITNCCDVYLLLLRNGFCFIWIIFTFLSAHHMAFPMKTTITQSNAVVRNKAISTTKFRSREWYMLTWEDFLFWCCHQQLEDEKLSSLNDCSIPHRKGSLPELLSTCKHFHYFFQHLLWMPLGACNVFQA